MQSGSTFLEPLEDAIILLLVELIRRLALLGWVDHKFDEALADDGSAESDADELVDLVLHLGVEADELKVATTVATLAYHALGDRMEGRKFHGIIFAGGLLLQLTQYTLEAVELADEETLVW